MPRTSAPIEHYVALTRRDALAQLRRIVGRPPPAPGTRQESFLPVETLLCYGLFLVFDPHRFGGSNLARLPAIAGTLARFFRRSPGSILSKMFNLDGSRANSARMEPELFAVLVSHPSLYRGLYATILGAARELGLPATLLPDFLDYLEAGPASASAVASPTEIPFLRGQDELPSASADVFAAERAHSDRDIVALETVLGPDTTEKLVVGRVRLAQHRFAADVVANWRRACVFCGFDPRALPDRSGLLHASHIKPWARSAARERVDVRNGLAACPIHDAAFDRGYLTIQDDYRIARSPLLEESVRAGDPRVGLYFRDALRDRIEIPDGTLPPHPAYLAYHRRDVFRR